MKKLIAGLLLILVPACLCWTGAAFSLCLQQDLEGSWINNDPESRGIHRVDLRFPCYDTAGASGPPAYIRVYGVCGYAPCDWGEIPVHTTYVAQVDGYPQTTRIDAKYVENWCTIDVTVLRVSTEEIIVYTFTHYTDDSGRQDISTLEFFRPYERYVTISHRPEPAKQGDNVTFTLQVGDTDHLTDLVCDINGEDVSITGPPFNYTFDTCKSGGSYHTDLALAGEAVYDDGETTPYYYSLDLTLGYNDREDNDRTYSFYVATDPNDGLEDRNVDRANAFMEEFDSLSESQYFWAEPFMYRNGAIGFANSVDLCLSIGHGRHHRFDTGSGEVDLSGTSFGSFTPCHRTGDLEYIGFVSCNTLSMNDNNNEPFWHYWLHEWDTHLDARPFTGLQMVLGFTTTVSISHWWLDDNGEDFLRKFARYLDNGRIVRDAWLDAAGDELDLGDSNNKAGVLYLEKYRNNRISTVRNDFIYGHPEYARQWIEYWD